VAFFVELASFKHILVSWVHQILMASAVNPYEEASEY
jgi:hypothetical protein